MVCDIVLLARIREINKKKKREGGRQEKVKKSKEDEWRSSFEKYKVNTKPEDLHLKVILIIMNRNGENRAKISN